MVFSVSIVTYCSEIHFILCNCRTRDNVFNTVGGIIFLQEIKYAPRHDKINKMTVHPAKTQISLGILPVWSESSLSAWRNFVSLASHWARSEVSGQTVRMPGLIWVFAGCTFILLVLSCRGSCHKQYLKRFLLGTGNLVWFSMWRKDTNNSKIMNENLKENN